MPNGVGYNNTVENNREMLPKNAEYSDKEVREQENQRGKDYWHEGITAATPFVTEALSLPLTLAGVGDLAELADLGYVALKNPRLTYNTVKQLSKDGIQSLKNGYLSLKNAVYKKWHPNAYLWRNFNTALKLFKSANPDVKFLTTEKVLTDVDKNFPKKEYFIRVGRCKDGMPSRIRTTTYPQAEKELYDANNKLFSDIGTPPENVSWWSSGKEYISTGRFNPYTQTTIHMQPKEDFSNFIFRLKENSYGQINHMNGRVYMDNPGYLLDTSKLNLNSGHHYFKLPGNNQWIKMNEELYPQIEYVAEQAPSIENFESSTKILPGIKRVMGKEFGTDVTLFSPELKKTVQIGGIGTAATAATLAALGGGKDLFKKDEPTLKWGETNNN